MLVEPLLRLVGHPDSVATDVLGMSGRAMLRALLAGERDPNALAELARGVLRKKIPLLRQALYRRFSAHRALLVGLGSSNPDLGPRRRRSTAFGAAALRWDAYAAS